MDRLDLAKIAAILIGLALVSGASLSQGAAAGSAQRISHQKSGKSRGAPRDSPKQVSEEGKDCLSCHQNTTPGIVQQWKESAHYREGVDCYSCHKPNDSDPATFEHYGKKIAVIVTPNYCNRCHSSEVKEFEGSRHAMAANFVGSLDNVLGEIVEGGAAATNGCQQCHGSSVVYQGDGKFDAATWPNSGIG